jgi:hypothetical protein
MPAFASLFLLLLASVLPQVEAPLPDRIGLGFPFAAAGAGGVLAGLAQIGSSTAKRERAMSWGGFVGFGAGAVVYVLALIVQVAS